MDIMELGAIGELVGGVAVLVTLIYLAVQLRQNTKIVRASSMQALTDSSSTFLTSIALDEETAEFFRRAFIAEEELSDTQRTRFNLLLHSMFRRYENAYLQHRLGTLERPFWQGWEATIIAVCDSARTRQWWSEARAFFSDEFGRFIDSVLQSEATGGGASLLWAQLVNRTREPPARA